MRDVLFLGAFVATLALTGCGGSSRDQDDAPGSGSAPATGSGDASGALRVQRAEIMDRRGFEKPMVAYTMFVPVGWESSGEVEYNPQNTCGPDPRLNWRATAPDGIGTITIIPEEKWSAGNFPQPPDNCLHSRVDGMRGYLEWWVQRNRPGATVLDYRERPELKAAYKNLERDANGMRSWADAGELLIGYEINGKTVRESITNAAFFMHSRFPGLGQGQGMELLQGMTGPGFAMRMPNGQLDFNAAEAVRQSIRSAPEWQQRMNQVMAERNQIAMDHTRKMGEINRRGAAERSAIIANTAREINEIQTGSWQSRNESMDRTQRETIETIREVETYTDPHYGGTVQLSHHYQHAWQLRDGSYVLTNDANFDPARAFNVSGTRLKPAE